MPSDSRVGEKIKMLREQLELSVDDLATRCECSAELIEQLEAGDVPPSLAPLVKITRALGVRLGTLLDDDAQIGPVIARAGETRQVTRFKGSGSGSEAGSLDFAALAADKASRHMEPFLIDVHPGASAGQLSSHEGEEFIVVVSGQVQLVFGRETSILNPGDSIYFNSVVPHNVSAVGGPASIYAVLYFPE